MKKLILFLLIVPSVSFGQYSTYYGTLDVNQNINANVNVNKNINVSGNIKKTVRTIDYGALANANAQSERNRIESAKIANEQEKIAMSAIANNPVAAYDYGENDVINTTRKQAKSVGFKKLSMYHKRPHKFLFIEIDWYI